MTFAGDSGQFAQAIIAHGFARASLRGGTEVLPGVRNMKVKKRRQRGRGEARLSGHATICRLDLDDTRANTCRMKVRALVSSFLLAAVSIGAVNGRLQAGAAPSQLPESALQLTPSEIKIYKSTETL